MHEWLRDLRSGFRMLLAYGFAPLNVSMEDDRPERLRGGQLTVAAFRALGVQPVLGRGLRDGDDRPGATPVILLGHSVWQERYRGSSDAIGATIRVNGTLRTIAGVMPESYATVFAAVVAVLALVSLGASFLPARRVTRIDPAAALTVE